MSKIDSPENVGAIANLRKHLLKHLLEIKPMHLLAEKYGLSLERIRSELIGTMIPLEIYLFGDTTIKAVVEISEIEPDCGRDSFGGSQNNYLKDKPARLRCLWKLKSLNGKETISTISSSISTDGTYGVIFQLRRDLEIDLQRLALRRRYVNKD